jgi:hypothetical protein
MSSSRGPPIRHWTTERLAVDLAGGEDEAEQLVGGLGPAVPVVRAGRHLGRDHVELPRPDEALVVVRRVVGATYHDAPRAFFERGPVDVVGEGHVLMLGPELGVAVGLPGIGVEAGCAHEGAVDHGVGPAEVVSVLVAVRLGQIRNHHARHALAVPGGGAHVDRHHVPPLRELGKHPLSNVPGRPREHDASLRHLQSPCF